MEVANVEMAAAWDGQEGDDWTENAEHYEAAGRYVWSRFEALVPVGATERVLDIGCGTGLSSRLVGRRANEGRVLGVDLSSRMLSRARDMTREDGLRNVDYVQADAQVHPFEAGAFDLAISDFGAMFFNDPVAAFTNIGRALRSGGRLAVLAWQEFDRNEWLRAMWNALALDRPIPAPPVSVPGPFGLADPDHVRDVLQAAGFTDVDFTSLTEPMWFGKDADHAWEFLRGTGVVRGLTSELDDVQRKTALERLRQVVDDHERPEGVLLDSAAWIISATKP